MVTLPTLREMLDAGVHFGHKTARWHPRMGKYIFMSKSGVHVINLEKTEEELQKATSFAASLAKENKTILFVGSKKQVAEILKNAALECGMPYVNFRWIGGTLTNFEAIKTAVSKFKKQKEDLSNESKVAEMSKKELSKLRQEVEKGERIFGGLINLNKKPDAIFIISVHDEIIAQKEAIGENIPIIGLCDTNADPTKINYPIPANDDATKSIELFSKLFSQLIKENKERSEKISN